MCERWVTAQEGVASHLVPPLIPDVTPTSPPGDRPISTGPPSARDLSTPKAQRPIGESQRQTRSFQLPLLGSLLTGALQAWRLNTALPSSSSSLLHIK